MSLRMKIFNIETQMENINRKVEKMRHRYNELSAQRDRLIALSQQYDATLNSQQTQGITSAACDQQGSVPDGRTSYFDDNSYNQPNGW